MNFLDGLKQVFFNKQTFYCADNIRVDTAPRHIHLQGLGVLKLVPMLPNLTDDQFVGYEVPKGHKGPKVERFVPERAAQQSRLPLPEALNIRNLASPATMGILAVVLPFLGVAVGLAIANAQPAIYVGGIVAIGILGWLYGTETEKMMELYHQAPAYMRFAA